MSRRTSGTGTRRTLCARGFQPVALLSDARFPPDLLPFSRPVKDIIETEVSKVKPRKKESPVVFRYRKSR